MGPVVVVVLAEGVELALESGDDPGGGLGRQVLLDGLVETLDLAAGLWVAGPGVLEHHPALVQGLTVLHLAKDFDLIAAVTGQRRERLLDLGPSLGTGSDDGQGTRSRRSHQEDIRTALREYRCGGNVVQ